MKQAFIFLISVALCSFTGGNTLKGTWEFVGGIYNGKQEGAPKEYSLHRKYNDKTYEAFALEKGEKPERFEAGRYSLKTDTCIDTETWCAQPSKIINIPVHYHYTIRNDTLTFKGVLPTGMTVEEYWKRVK